MNNPPSIISTVSTPTPPDYEETTFSTHSIFKATPIISSSSTSSADTTPDYVNRSSEIQTLVTNNISITITPEFSRQTIIVPVSSSSSSEIASHEERFPSTSSTIEIVENASFKTEKASSDPSPTTSSKFSFSITTFNHTNPRSEASLSTTVKTSNPQIVKDQHPSVSTLDYIQTSFHSLDTSTSSYVSLVPDITSGTNTTSNDTKIIAEKQTSTKSTSDKKVFLNECFLFIVAIVTMLNYRY